MTRMVVLLCALGCVALTSRAPASRRKSEANPLFLRAGTANLLRFTRPFLLDLLWLRALNVISDAESPDRNLALFSFGESITEIDRRFYTAYYYMGLNTPYQQSRDKWLYGREASKLFTDGLAQFPSDLRFHLFLGYNLFFVEKKYREASGIFLAASKLPDSPPFAAPLATRLLAHGGEPEEALKLAQSLVGSTTDEDSRAQFEQRVRELEVEVLLQKVDKANIEFKMQRGHFAKTISELNESGVYSGDDDDGHGGKITLKDTGKATSTSLERRIELYE